MNQRTISIIVLLSLAFAGGCRRQTATGHSKVTASVGNRSVAVDIDGPAWVKPEEGRISVKLTGHEIVIEPERITVDAAERAKVSAAAKKFDVTVVQGVVMVTADGAELLRTSLKN